MDFITHYVCVSARSEVNDRDLLFSSTKMTLMSSGEIESIRVIIHVQQAVRLD